MSVGLQLLRSVVGSEAKDFLSLEIEDQYFITTTEKKAYHVFQKHVESYGTTPSHEVLDSKQIVLPEALEGSNYYADQLKQRYQHRELKKLLSEAAEALNNKDTTGAREILMNRLLDLNKVHHKNKIIDFATDGYDIVMAEHEAHEKGLHEGGLMFGWPTLDQMTGGLLGGDVVGFVGRPGMGKTYMMLYGALNSWRAGAVPLFISMEMRPVSIIQRLSAIYSTVPISPLKTGKLTTKQRHRLAQRMLSMQDKNNHPFHVVDGNLLKTPEDVLMVCRQLQPTALFIDAAYLLKNKNFRLGKWERVTENVEFIKSEIAEAMNLPAVLSYQINREGGKKKGNNQPALEDIAYSDAIGQICSCVVGLFQDESVETMVSRVVSILKGRNGEHGEFRINWAFDQGPDYMNFSECKEETFADLDFL